MKTRTHNPNLFAAAKALTLLVALSLAATATQAAVHGQRLKSFGVPDLLGGRGLLTQGSEGALHSSTNDAPAKSSQAIPWSQLGAKAGADYKGDGLAVIPTAEGARLRCVFQRLEGEATSEGLWLTSTVIPPSGTVNDRFRVTAAAVGRERSADLQSAFGGSASKAGHRSALLPNTGKVSIDGQRVRFTRPGLVEEYTASMDGVRQDFVVRERPAGEGELALRLAVSGAKVEPAAFGAQLVLENSGRKIGYSRLHVTDATGKELSARMEVVEEGARHLCRFDAEETLWPGNFLDALENPTLKRAEDRAPGLAILVKDADAVYPVRIDPTFSDANWISMGGLPGAESSVFAMVVDGSGNLYIGGTFTVIGDVIANRIAKWNGSSWTALGSGIDNEVYALAVSGSDVYAGGRFFTAGGNAANYIAKWNGSSWAALGSGMGGGASSFVYALAVSGSNLYAGGGFTTAGGSAASRIAKWNGSSWTAVGSGMNNRVSALAMSGSDLYAGGMFTMATNSGAVAVTVNRIAKWDGTNWTALGLGMNNNVSALAASGTDLYAGGDFTTATNSGPAAVTVNRIAKWDGSSWSALGLGMNNSVWSLMASGSDVYAGGDFIRATNSGPVAVTVSQIAKWNGSSWSALGSGMNSRVSALVMSGSDVYAGGEFTTAGGVAANYVAKWNGSSWSALGSGLNALVNALALSGSDLYAGGGFTTAGGSGTNRIARWNGSSWSALGSGMNDIVYALAVSGSDLYAGGRFTTAGGSNANYIAKWNGTNWTALGSGMNGPVWALAVSGSNLYAGGAFTAAGGSNVNYIAKWNGTNWTALGSGMGGVSASFSYVYALAVSGSNLYAGGEFLRATNSGGVAVTVNRIAKWDGNSWTALGSGMNNNIVYALAASGSNVYAGGDFIRATNSGGVAVTVNRIAKWDGSSWSALGSGLNATVYALAASGSDLYAGGDFSTAGGSIAWYIANWNGTNWTALGSGMGGAGFPNVNALALSGSDLYAGGRFTTAGGNASAFIARADLLNLPGLSILRSGTDVIVSWPSPSTGFALQSAHDVTGLFTNIPSATNPYTNSTANPKQFFRLIGN